MYMFERTHSADGASVKIATISFTTGLLSTLNLGSALSISELKS